MLSRLIPFLVLMPTGLVAQDEPLSAIDWLENAPLIASEPILKEPPVTSIVQRPVIDVQPLDQAPRLIGLVPSTTTGLPNGLWERSAPEDLARLIAQTPVSRSPSMQKLLFTLLLTEARAPLRDRREKVLVARAARLMDLGASDPALALMDVAGPTLTPDLFAMWFDAALLTGEETRACATVTEARSLLSDEAARIYCAVLTGDWRTAALLLETAHALRTIPRARLDLIDRFLSADVFEGASSLPPPLAPSVVDIRMFEAIGERLPAASLPRAYASVDLRDVAGWKAQVEAAERLVRSGALEPNRLLGLYTERRAAASGGVWDRVRAVQQFETALAQPSTGALAATLPVVWAQMRRVGLETAFARLFATRLAQRQFDDPEAARLAWHIRLLSPEYETAAAQPPGDSAQMKFLAALARGVPQDVPAPDPRARAIANAFAGTSVLPQSYRFKRDAGQLGEYILQGMGAFDRGMQGDLNALEIGLAALRAVGLEDIARRAALHAVLTGPDRS